MTNRYPVAPPSTRSPRRLPRIDHHPTSNASAALMFLGVGLLGLAFWIAGSGPLMQAIAFVGFLAFSLGLPIVGRLVLMLTLVSAPLLSVGITQDTRFLSVVPLLAIWFRPESEGPPPKLNPVTVLLGTVTIAAAVSALWGTDPAGAVEGAQSLALLTIATYVTSRRCSPRNVVMAVYYWSFALVLLSLGAIVIGVDFASRAGRVQGIMGNANGFGILALILLGTAAIYRTRWIVFAAPAAALVVLLSESRASALAFLLMGTVLLAHSLRRRFGRVAVFSVVAFAVVMAALGATLITWDSSTGLLRGTRSRDSVWSLLWQDFQRNPWGGRGWNGQSSGYESIYLATIAQLGIVGFVIVISAVAVLLVRLSTWGIAGVTLALGVLVNSAFEGWLLAGGSAYAWAVWLLVTADPPLEPEGLISSGTPN